MNENVKKEAADRGVRLWEVAARLGINDGNLSRRLRFELSNEGRKQMLAIIEDISRTHSVVGSKMGGNKMTDGMTMTLTVAQLCEELHISRPTASALTRRADFPTLHIGRRVLIPREGLRHWIADNIENNSN